MIHNVSKNLKEEKNKIKFLLTHTNPPSQKVKKEKKKEKISLFHYGEIYGQREWSANRVLPWKSFQIDWTNEKNNEEILLPSQVNPWEIDFSYDENE